MLRHSDEVEISVRGVTFAYRGSSRQALRDISFEVRRGEVVGIVGPSAAGKSTLVKCLDRLVPAFEHGTFCGEVSVAGIKLDHLRVCDVAPMVGMVFQDFESQLFSTNVAHEVAFALEQCGYAREEMERRVRAALRWVGLEGFERRDPATLSGGEKQRLAIAAVMALRPRVIVLDEPTTDLDPQGRSEVFELLRELRQEDFTLLLVEHDLEALRLCDRLLVLKDGRLIADLPPFDLMERLDLLEQCRLRPPDLNLLCARLEIRPHVRTLDEAEEVIRSRYKITKINDSSDSEALPVANLNALVPESTELSRPGSGAEVLVEALDLSYSYPEGVPVLERVNLTIKAGERVAVVGRNGSGKSTLAKLLVGILRPSSGRILLKGRDLSELSISEISHQIGFVFQNPDHQLFAATVEEEIIFGLRNFGFDAKEAAERTEHVLAQLELGQLRDRDPFLLSKGERQRVAVAAVLALNPRLLILDEPTTGLDFFEQLRMMELLRRINQDGVAIMIITHTPWLVASFAQRVVMMERGRKVFDGPVRRFFSDRALLATSAFRLPEITALGWRFGVVALTVDELVQWVKARS